MAFTFPASPTTGQRFTPVGGPTYVWTGTTWDATGAAVNASTFAAKTGWTANQVLFANASGTLAQSSKLGWTDTTGTLVIDGITAGRGGGAIATNTTFGAGALAANTAGTNNVAVGDSALAANTASYNTAVGSLAMASHTTNAGNVAVGDSALTADTSGANNTAVGSGALKANTTGVSNTSLGAQSLSANQTGTNNVAVGTSALAANTASFNTAVGSGALVNNTNVAANTALGWNAMAANTGGVNQTALGYEALGNTIATGGNTGVGYRSGRDITTGVNNTILGCFTGLGGPLNSTGSNFVVLSTGTGQWTAYNQGLNGWFQINNSSNWSVTSDKRIKENITPVNNGLEVILALNPVSFNYILTGKKDVSFIAQEYMKVLPEQVGTHAASPEEKELTGSDELYDINPNLVPYLVKAIQELAAKNDALEARLAKLEGK